MSIYHFHPEESASQMRDLGYTIPPTCAHQVLSHTVLSTAAIFYLLRLRARKSNSSGCTYPGRTDWIRSYLAPHKRTKKVGPLVVLWAAWRTGEISPTSTGAGVWSVILHSNLCCVCYQARRNTLDVCTKLAFSGRDPRHIKTCQVSTDSSYAHGEFSSVQYRQRSNSKC